MEYRSHGISDARFTPESEFSCGLRRICRADYLASLARHHEGKLDSFDKGLVALHSDVGVAVEA